MSKSLLPEAIGEYIHSTFVHESPVLAKLRAETAEMPNRAMQLDADQAQLLAMLIGVCGAKLALEIGVFTGYSSIAAASALAAGGKLIACDVSEDYTSVARRYWKEAGLEDRIELRLGPALETLKALRAEGHVFDFVFIDADKPNYLHYYEAAVELTRPNAIIALDNMLLSGKVADPDDQNVSAAALRALNEKIYADERVDMALTTIGDGMTLVIKR